MILRIAELLRGAGKEEKGLTLIELMIVLAIVAIIAALAIPQIMGWLDAATEEAAEADANSLTSAIQMRALQENISPDQFEEGDDIFGETPDIGNDEWALEEFIDLEEICERHELDYASEECPIDEGPFEFDNDEAKVLSDF